MVLADCINYGWQLVLACFMQVLMVEPASMLFVTEPSEKWKEDLLPQRPPAAFYAKWGEALVQQAAANLEVDITVAYNMHCGGSMGIEAFNFLQVGVQLQLTNKNVFTRLQWEL